MMEEQDKILEVSDESKQTSELVQDASAVEAESTVEPQVEVAAETPPQETPAVNMHWCVLRVASNKEEIVREALVRKMAVEGLGGVVGRILVPMERRPAPRGKIGKKKYVDRKMYPGYVFVEMILTENGSIDENVWFAIKETNGVGDFIGSGGKPSPMAPADVDKMLAQIEQAQEGAPVVLEFAKGDMVKIKEGAFENFEGEIDEVLPDKGLVRVVVTIFGRATPVELEYWQVEKI
ncbi:MAG: transcription termination/antitermination factor NusG [Phycisphaerae bacterium]|nr:transcription termination/antitermination factor NusG [Phycisphaerae bacterium]